MMAQGAPIESQRALANPTHNILWCPDSAFLCQYNLLETPVLPLSFLEEAWCHLAAILDVQVDKKRRASLFQDFAGVGNM